MSMPKKWLKWRLKGSRDLLPFFYSQKAKCDLAREVEVETITCWGTVGIAGPMASMAPGPGAPTGEAPARAAAATRLRGAPVSGIWPGARAGVWGRRGTMGPIGASAADMEACMGRPLAWRTGISLEGPIGCCVGSIMPGGRGMPMACASHPFQ